MDAIHRTVTVEVLNKHIPQKIQNNDLKIIQGVKVVILVFSHSHSQIYLHFGPRYCKYSTKSNTQTQTIQTYLFFFGCLRSHNSKQKQKQKQKPQNKNPKTKKQKKNSLLFHNSK